MVAREIEQGLGRPQPVELYSGQRAIEALIGQGESDIDRRPARKFCKYRT